MNSEIKKILNKIEKNGFEAYIVGGFVRDYLLCKKSNDVDICTNALPKDIQNIFGNSKANGPYGSYNIKTNKYNYDITTYRKEYEFVKRKPSKVEYTNNLLEDLSRRDFTMNAICMNSKGKIINLMHGVEDLENKQIKMIGNPINRIKEDPLRILRAIRFSCTLDLQIEENLKRTMKEQINLVNDLSLNRIKQELDSILLSPNFQKGLELLEEFNILSNFDIKVQKISYVNDVCGMWAQFNNTGKIVFSKNEFKRILKMQELLQKENLTELDLFDYGLDTVMVVAKIKQIPENKIAKMYKKMPLETRKDLKITFQEIKAITQLPACNVKKIERRLIELVLTEKIKNKKDILINEIKKEVK